MTIVFKENYFTLSCKYQKGNLLAYVNKSPE